MWTLSVFNDVMTCEHFLSLMMSWHVKIFGLQSLMMSWHVNTFHITGPLWGEPLVTAVVVLVIFRYQFAAHLFCLINSLLGLTSNKYQSSALLALCEGNPPMTSGTPSQNSSNMESIFKSFCIYPWTLYIILGPEFSAYKEQVPFNQIIQPCMTASYSSSNDGCFPSLTAYIHIAGYRRSSSCLKLTKFIHHFNTLPSLIQHVHTFRMDTNICYYEITFSKAALVKVLF